MSTVKDLEMILDYLCGPDITTRHFLRGRQESQRKKKGVDDSAERLESQAGPRPKGCRQPLQAGEGRNGFFLGCPKRKATQPVP